MRFGEIAVGDAKAAILGHSVKHGAGVFKKGRSLSEADLALLQSHGINTVFAALLAPDDVPEDEAAAALAGAIAGDGAIVHEPFTGRANLHAGARGLVIVDAERVRALNRVHESMTLATVAPFDLVEARQMIATVKIIPFAVPGELVEQALGVIGADPVIRVEVFKDRTAGLVITRLGQTKPSIIVKSDAAMRERIEALGGRLGEVVVTEHVIAEVAAAIRRLHAAGHAPILVFGASAIVDRGDVIPAALIEAGGDLVHLGMPVDPGNLLMFGRLDGVPVIGVPSCARSPKVNGFDWVLQRVMAGLHVSGQDIMDMGAGGLLKEILTRPLPREAASPKAPQIAAIVLAAGRSTRMGGPNKLLIEIAGKPMVRRTVEAVLASKVRPVIVVTGHEEEAVRQALAGLDVTLVANPAYRTGMASSLKAGLAAVPEAVSGAVVALGDMPLVAPRVIDKLIAAFNPAERRAICVPVSGAERGNPVLWGRQFFAEMMRLEGDQGAKALVEAHADDVAEVAVPDTGVLTDFDTPAALEHGRT